MGELEEQVLIRRLIEKVSSCQSLEKLEQYRLDLLGRNGLIAGLFSKLKTLSGQGCRKFGQELNELKLAAVEAISRQLKELEAASLKSFLQQDWCDVTLPGKARSSGRIHPVSHTKRELLDILATFGFSYESGPEIEDEWHNFTALNIAQWHPARQMVDTFYIKPGTKLLRTHTSTVQIRIMQGRQPPFQFVSAGRVYRRDSDATHTPMFHQIEGMLIDTKASLANLKFILSQLVYRFFGQQVQMRLRPSFFPFTSPSIELDIKEDPNSPWLEVAGAGMVHPKVLERMKIGPSWQGFAFGLGVERFAMIRYGIKDMRQCFEGDLRWIQHYGI